MKWFSFYHKYFPNLKESHQKQNVICPFHADKEPSFSLDLETGLYYCHSCREGGDVFKFYMKQNNCSFTVAKHAILGSDKIVILSETEVEIAHEKLVQSETIKNLLFVKRAWTPETIKRFKLGWADERVYIPIYSKDSVLLNIRKYDVLHKSKEKFKGITGHNQIRLWPEEALKNDIVLLFAGEPDTILASQLGFGAITFTGGEGVFKESLLPAFVKKKVYIIYDIDQAGRKASQNVAKKLAEHADEVYIITLPSDGLPPNGDFTDFFLRCLDNKLDFTALWNAIVQSAVRIEADEKLSSDADYEEVDFHTAVRDLYYGKKIQFKATAIGKNFSPFFAPKRIEVTCDFTRGDSCKECKLFATGGSYTIELSDSNVLDLIKCTQGEQKNRIRSLIGIAKCSQFKSVIDTQTIEEVFIAPIIDSERIDRQFIVRKSYCKSYDLQLNKAYKLIGTTIPDAKTQEATHLFDRQEPELSNLETFKLTDREKSLLRIFQPPKDEYHHIDVVVHRIARDLSYNVPEVIVGREKLILAYDLVFHSVLRFNFLGSAVEKGWIEMLALGDTRTGKTKTAIKLCRHYRVGEYITLESATLPGLIGGVSQVGRDVSFSWGVLPINDGRLVVLDEANGIDVSGIGNLSSIRDNGIAERTVVGSTRRTTARVRLIWISNPRSNTRISYYSSGVEAIRELMGRPEDVARLDYAMVVAKEDVDINRINQLTHTIPEHEFNSEVCNRCLMWAWSRKEKNIKFTKESEKAILHYAIEMSNKYSDAIPLVQGTVQRIKIAKLAVALACRLYSTEDGENVIVRPAHVEYVSHFLYDLYDSPYFGYKDFSQIRKQEDTLEGKDKIRKDIKDLVNPKQFIAKMLSQNMLGADDIMDFTGKERERAREFKTELVNANCLKKKKFFYVKTPEFVKLLKDLSKEMGQ